MQDYEKIFADNVFNGIREKLKGKVTTYVSKDVLYMKIEFENFSYVNKIDNLAEHILNGLNSEHVTYEFCNKYKKFVNKLLFTHNIQPLL